jgi:hypothetical protein
MDDATMTPTILAPASVSGGAPAASVDQDLRGEVASLRARVEQLEARLEELVAGTRRTRSIGSSSGGGGGAGALGPAPDWTSPYEVAQIKVSETWIEMHEQSARPQLHRLISAVVEAEGPVTIQLALRRVREAWGLKRAGQRIQQVFDQAVRQLAANGKLVRGSGDVLTRRGEDATAVRVPTADDSTRRSVDEVPAPELELALLLTARDAGRADADDLTMAVSRLFGWTRRGTEIQQTLDARLEALLTRGALRRDGASIVPAEDAAGGVD